jgi:hypothetical protein
MADKNYTPKQAAAHYRGLAAGAKRMKSMGGGASGKPPKKGCALVLMAGLGLGILQLAGLVEFITKI